MSTHEHEPRCEHCADAAAYVLGALQTQELQPFHEHLAGCAICGAEVAQLQAVADSLAIGVPRRFAPEGLRARVMATVHAEAELLKAAGHEADRPSPAPPRRRPGLVSALAAAAALGVGLLIGALAINTGATTQRMQVVRAVVELPGHHATAELRRVGSHLELVVVGMPTPPKGRIYEVWLVPRGVKAPQPTDALFSVTQGGDGSVGVPGNAQDIGKVLVTDEPLGGSLKPTRNPVIVAST